MTVTISKLKPRRLVGAPSGIELIELEGPPPITGTVCRIDLRHYEFRLFCFRDLINKSLHPDSPDGCYTQENVNLGCSVPDFIKGDRFECEGLRAYSCWCPPYRRFYRRCLIASNTLQTNFISSKGFVIDKGKVVAKPLHAWGRTDPEYSTLGVAGDYTCLLVEGTTARVTPIRVEDPTGSRTNPSLPEGCYGVASPMLVEQSPKGPRIVNIQQSKEPFRDGRTRRLKGDCVDWDPKSTASSFTAFGVAANAEGEDTILIMVSIFAGEWGIHIDTNSGVLPKVMGQVLIRYGGAHDGILGGGAADTQQFVHWRFPRFRIGPVRTKSPAMSRGEVNGIRGLGAIAAVLHRNDPADRGLEDSTPATQPL